MNDVIVSSWREVQVLIWRHKWCKFFLFFSSWICGTYLLCCIAPSMAEPSYILSEVTAKVEITVGPPQFDSKFGLLLVSDREMGKKSRSHNSSGRCSTGLLSGSQIIDCNYRFCDDYFFLKVASFTGVMRGCVISIFIEERIKTQSLKRSASSRVQQEERTIKTRWSLDIILSNFVVGSMSSAYHCSSRKVL